jgi:branched-chain amino acid transport system substrate-binding protein
MKRLQILIMVLVTLALAAGTYFVPSAPAATMGPVTDPIGVVKVDKGQPIVIAYWLVITGPNGNLGIDSRYGIEIAIDDKKAVAGHPIRLIGEDAGCNPEGGTTAATKLAANKQIVAAVGSTCSSEARPGAPILWKAGIATVSPSNTAPDLTDPKRGPDYDGYLRTAHNDLVQGAVGATFVRTVLKFSKVATVHDGSPYAEGLANAFAASFKKQGDTITAQEAVNVGDTDMRPVLTKIAATKPELLYFPIFVAEGGFIARQAKEVVGLEKVTLMGADGLFDPNFLKAAGSAAVGMYQSSPDTRTEVLGSAYTVFLQKYQKKSGGAPLSVFHAHAYDAANVIFAAIERVAKADAQGNTYIGRKALRDELFATTRIKGITGTLTCNQYGDCADPHLAVYQITSGDPAKWDPGKTNPTVVYPVLKK